jgi:DNA-directed RNA polymerase specialized sigma24 family protein
MSPHQDNDDSNVPDENLVLAAQKDDTKAFEVLFARHREEIYARVFNMMRNEAKSVDLSQEVWVKGWQKHIRFQGESSFVAGMTRIVVRLREHKRRQGGLIQSLDEGSGGDWSQN